MVFAGLLDLALVVFAIVVFAEYAKVRAVAAQGFSLIATGGVLFLLAATFAELSVWELVTNAVYGKWVFEGIGGILVLVGALWAVYQLLPFKK